MARRGSDVWEWPLNRDHVATEGADQSHFEAELELPAFRPDEIDVKVDERDLIIHGLQDRQGTPGREILRTYKLPEDVDPSSVKTSIADGCLKISASKRRQIE